MFGLYIRVMVATGARRAEVCGLRWTDVDPATATLTVQRSYTLVPGVRGDRPTKTRSARTVALDPVTLDELDNAWMATRALAQQCGLDVELRRTGYIFATDPDRRVGVAPRHGERPLGASPQHSGPPLGSLARLATLPGDPVVGCRSAGVPVCPSRAATVGTEEAEAADLSAEGLLKHADLAMYAAKRDPAGGVHVFAADTQLAHLDDFGLPQDTEATVGASL